MKKKFYDHIVTLEEIHTELDTLSLSEDEKHHLKLLAHSTVHQVVLDTVLSELPEEKKHTFLSHVEESDHQTLWNFLTGNIHDVEAKISQAAESIKKELLKDVKELQKKE